MLRRLMVGHHRAGECNDAVIALTACSCSSAALLEEIMGRLFVIRPLLRCATISLRGDMSTT
jgi:hypothetical protein